MPMPETNCAITVATAAPVTPPMKHQHKQQIKRNIEHRGDRKEHQRHNRIADRTQQICEKVIKERRQYAKKDIEQVLPHERRHCIRRL